ncbi:unnamed protein product [Rotaria sordida]|uniref:Uncharacterized protein n=1 Tax=Rotaria sordida TaxID=392033 RepID=A0A814NZ86_9BILA|nr:unnamed protein product [Rotaria sordida]CAF1176456.1 unnamed protein product [Rotaria sordida]
MDTIIHRLFQNLYIVIISIMSMFNVPLIYMIDTNDEHNMNDHDENTINESTDKYSETVTEIPFDPAVQAGSMCLFIVQKYILIETFSKLLGLQTDMRIVHTHNQNNVRFGQTQPCHSVELLFLKIQKLINGRYFCIFLMCLGVCIYYKQYNPNIVLSSNECLQIHDKLMLMALNNTYQDFIMKEENVIIDDKINSSVKDNKSNVKDILKTISAITIVDNLTCTLYDAFLYGFTPPFCWKDDIKNFTPAGPPDDIHSFYDSNEKNPMNIVKNSINTVKKADKLLSCLKKIFNDILNKEQSRQKCLINEQVISKTVPIDVLSDQISQDEENTINEDKVDHEELILPFYSMSMSFKKQQNPICPNQG